MSITLKMGIFEKKEAPLPSGNDTSRIGGGFEEGLFGIKA